MPTETVPFKPQPESAMQARVEDAFTGTFDPASDRYVPPEERTAEHVGPHVFDFADGMRVILSQHVHDEAGLLVHAYATYPDESRRPPERTEALWALARHTETLLEGAFDEVPPILEYGMSETDHPHIFYPYPSDAFDEQ
jgi:hypothetical protein